MTLKFFYDNYKLSEIDIKKMYIRNNKLYLTFAQNAYLELIANGYRPEMNVEYNNTFIFNVNHLDKKYKKDDLKDIKYDNNLIFVLANENIELFGDIEIN